MDPPSRCRLNPPPLQAPTSRERLQYRPIDLSRGYSCRCVCGGRGGGKSPLPPLPQPAPTTYSLCSCNSGFWGLSCSNACPGLSTEICTGHGTCLDGPWGTGDCVCSAGYGGPDCSIACPSGVPCVDGDAAGCGARGRVEKRGHKKCWTRRNDVEVNIQNSLPPF